MRRRPIVAIALVAAVLAVVVGYAITRHGTATPTGAPTSPATSAGTPSAIRTTTYVGLLGSGYYDVATGPDTSNPLAQHSVIPAGTYQTTADVTAGCYWWIYPRGLSGHDAMEHMHGDSPDSGRPTVHLEDGDTWQVWDCGTWILTS